MQWVQLNLKTFRVWSQRSTVSEGARSQGWGGGVTERKGGQGVERSQASGGGDHLDRIVDIPQDEC